MFGIDISLMLLEGPGPLILNLSNLRRRGIRTRGGEFTDGSKIDGSPLSVGPDEALDLAIIVIPLLQETL